MITNEIFTLLIFAIVLMCALLNQVTLMVVALVLGLVLGAIGWWKDKHNDGI